MTLRPLSNHERIAVRNSAWAICRFDETMKSRGSEGRTPEAKVSKLTFDSYKTGLLTGLHIGSPDWGQNLPEVVERYISRVGCEAIMQDREGQLDKG